MGNKANEEAEWNWVGLLIENVYCVVRPAVESMKIQEEQLCTPVLWTDPLLAIFASQEKDLLMPNINGLPRARHYYVLYF